MPRALLLVNPPLVDDGAPWEPGRSRPIGSHAQAAALVQGAFPSAMFHVTGKGVFEGEGYRVRIDLGAQETVSSVKVWLEGGDTALAALQRLCAKTGWRAYDPELKAFLDLPTAPLPPPTVLSIGSPAFGNASPAGDTHHTPDLRHDWRKTAGLIIVLGCWAAALTPWFHARPGKIKERRMHAPMSAGRPADVPAPDAPQGVKVWEYALWPDDGRRLSDFRVPPCPALGQDGAIYVGGTDGMYALYATGELKWKTPVRLAFLPHPAVVADDGSVYIANRNGPLGFSPKGERNLRFEFNYKDGWSALAVARDGALYAAVGDALLSFNPKSHKVVFNGSVPGEIARDTRAKAWGPPVFNKQGAARSAHHGGLDAWGGDYLGRARDNFSPDMYLAVSSDDMTYAASRGGIVAAGEKRLLSAEKTPHKTHGPPVIAPDGTVYAGFDDRLCAFGPNLHLKWAYAAGDAVRSAPAVADSRAVLFGAGKRLFALSPEGKLEWSFEAGGEVFSPTIDNFGNIFFLAGDGKLYCVRSPEGVRPVGGLAGSQWPKWAADVRNTGRQPDRF